jgi:hypothetical protein
MMKKIALCTFILIVIFRLSSFSQDPALRWARQMGGSNTDGAASTVVDINGNVYTTGSFTYTVDFDPGAGSCYLTALGGYDVFISKLDASGNFVWAKQFGGTSFEVGYSIAVDGSGNVYITGSFDGTVDFDPGSATYSLTSAGMADVFVCKLNASGSLVWARRMGGTAADEGEAIAVDANGNVYTAGYFIGTSDFDPGSGTSNLTSYSNSSDIFISRLTSSGSFSSISQLGGTHDDFAESIAVDNNGNTYTTGQFQYTADFDPGAGTNNLTSHGGNDVFVSKLTSYGGFIWAKQLGGGNNDDGQGIAIDGSGNVYTTGEFDGIADFDPGSGTFNLTSAGSYDVFVSKLDASGNFVWAKGMGGSGFSDAGYGIALDPAGNVYSTGMFEGTADFDPGSGTHNLISAGDADIFISKLDAAGNFAWAKQMGGPAYDDGKAIALYNSYYIYTSGSFNGTADFDPGPGTYYFTSAGNADIFVHQMSQCAAPVAPTNTTPSANQHICFNTGTLLSASGSGILQWYTAATGGTYLGNGAYFDTGSLAASITYYVQDSTCDASTRTAIPVTVNPKITSTGSSQVNVSCFGMNDGSITINAGGGTPPYAYSWFPGGSTSPTLTGLMPGNYSCTITDALGCTATANFAIIQPAVITTTQNINRCYGQSITIGSNTYSSSGTYIDVLTSIYGCDSTVTTHLTINPEIDVTTSFLSGVTITANQAGASYQWIECNNVNAPIAGQTNKSFTAIANGDYAVIVTVGPCSDTSDCVTINSVGMDEPRQAEILSIHPNPNNGLFAITLADASAISITNELGVVIYSCQYRAGIHQLVLNEQPKGIYLVKVQCRDTSRTYRMIVVE